MSAKNQIDKLAKFIMLNYPDDIIDGGAGDVAIKIIQRLETSIKGEAELPASDNTTNGKIKPCSNIDCPYHAHKDFPVTNCMAKTTIALTECVDYRA